MNLQKYLLFAVLFLGMGCKDDDDNTPSISAYLMSNGIVEYQETDSGLIYVIDEVGEGNLPEYGQTLTVNYTGYTLNDKEFDSNLEGTFDVALGVSGVIEGWNEGLAFYRKGSSGTLYIPSELAYGGFEGHDLETEDLKFDVEIVDIK